MTHPGADFWIKQYDTAKPLFRTLEDGAGNRQDIAGADVLFIMRFIADPDTGHRPGSTLFVKEASNDQADDDTMGDVHYDWEEGDTDIAAGYYAEWEVTYDDGTVETFPNSGHMKVAIIEHLEGVAS